VDVEEPDTVLTAVFRGEKTAVVDEKDGGGCALAFRSSIPLRQMASLFDSIALHRSVSVYGGGLL